MRMIVAIAAMAALTSSANAQSAGFDWSGVYGGAHIGYGSKDSEIVFDRSPTYTVDLDANGFVGGLYAGYNIHLTSGFVVGIEGDATLSNPDTQNATGLSNGQHSPGYLYGTDQKWAASFRARLGYAIDRMLPYIAAGVAAASYEHFENNLDPFSESRTYRGWTIGVGFEYAATDNLIIRSEYRYSDFGSHKIVPVRWRNHEVDLATHELRLGIAYKF